MYTFEDIYQFLDSGESPDERQLFKAIAESDELRLSLKQVIALKVASAKIQSSSPNEHLKAKLFGSLGLITHDVPENPMIKQKPINKTSIPGYLLTSFISVIVTVLIMSFVFYSGNNQGVSTKEVFSGILAHNLTNFSYKANSNPVNLPNKYNSNDSQQTGNTADVIYRYSKPGNRKWNLIKSKMDNLNITHNNTNHVRNNPDFENSEINKVAQFQINNINNDSESIYNEVTEPDFMYPGANEEDEESGRFSIGFCVSNDYHKIEPTISPTEYAAFNNTSINLSYRIIESVNIGLEYKRENYFQKYTGYDREGMFKQYEQQPNLETYSAILSVYRDFGIIFIPYVNTGIGINRAGSVLKGGFGVNLPFLNDIMLQAGYEYSKLIYHHINNKFNSEKASFLIGINYSF